MSSTPDKALEGPSPAERARRRRTNVVVAVVVVVALVAVALAAMLSGGDASDDVTAAEQCASPAPTAVAEPLTFDSAPEPVRGTWEVTLQTNCGPVELALDGDAAPQAVGNLVHLAEQGYFDDTPCHRLTTSGIYVLQCGDPTGTGTGGPGYSFGPVENAPADDVYPAGTVAMARIGGDGESMGSQFFVVYQDSTIPSDGAGGYSVLGQVTDGLDVVESVAEGGLGPDGVAPAIEIGIESTSVEEST